MKKIKMKKQFLAIIVALLAVVSITFYVQWKVSAEVALTTAYFSNKDIPPRTQITKDMIQERDIPVESLPPNAYSEKDEIIGKWTVPGYGVSSNSYFYESKVTETENMPDAGILDLKDEEVALPLLVDIESSLGNSIVPGSYVDLYFKGTMKEEDTEKPIYGKVASRVRVTAVKDSNAMNVFEAEDFTNRELSETDSGNEKSREMAKLYIFAVDESTHETLTKGKMIGDIVPVSTGTAYAETADREKSSVEMTTWINNQSHTIITEDTESEETLAENSQ